MLAIIVFLIILGVLIFVHELGHFAVARRNGIKADEFGFGFPPRVLGIIKHPKSGKWKYIFGNKHIESENTIYSINLIPLGGFVRIKGEDGQGTTEADSFAGKSAWVRIKVLAAGVTMNFILAWLAISLGYAIGAPQQIEDTSNVINAKIQITEVLEESPASQMGIKIGDEIVQCFNNSSFCKNKFVKVSSVQEFINSFKGKEIVLEVKRGKEILKLSGIPRTDYPAGEGPLGISLARISIVNYPVHEAILKGAVSTVSIIKTIIFTLGDVMKNLVLGKKVAVDISGPVGIAIISKQVTDLGFVYILQFMALLSINLGLINIFPFPALDGGRILFILIEKIKGSPVTQRVEQAFHTIGFFLLIALMMVVTFNDFIKLDILGKIKGLF